MADKDEEYFVEPDGTHNYEKTPTGAWKWGHDPASKATQFKKG